MKKKLRLKRFVLPMIYVILVFVFVMSTYAVFSARNDIPEEEINYVSNIIWSNDTPVVSTDKVLQKPYSNEKVTIGRYYYNYKDESKNQQNAIIFASLSFLVRYASSTELTLAHLIPFTLLQAILIPIPLPHIAIP